MRLRRKIFDKSLRRQTICTDLTDVQTFQVYHTWTLVSLRHLLVSRMSAYDGVKIPRHQVGSYLLSLDVNGH